MKRNEQRSWILVIIFSTAVIVGLGTLSQYVQWRQETKSMEAHHTAPPVRSIDQKARSALKLPQPNPDSSLTTAINRLNRAFQNHSSMDVEDMVAKVNSSTPAGQEQPCPLAWHDNEATLSIRSDRLHKLSPGRAITTCADAIEQLP